MTPSTDYLADLGLALELAALADVITTGRFGAGDLAVDTKPDLTPVSDADRAVEQAIRTRVAEARPDDGLVGEEFGHLAGTSGRRWVVDPIDGTKNFVRGVPVWATLIALLDDTDRGDGDPVVGVVSAPALGRRWWAYRGGGAWAHTLDGRPRRLAVSQVARLEDASLSYASVPAWPAGGRREALLALADRVWRSRAYGDFWSYMLVAEGAVDLAAEPELSLWDMAALAPIVTEAGGRFTGLNGTDGVHQGNAAASNGRLHKAFLAALRPRRPSRAPAADPGPGAKGSAATTSGAKNSSAKGPGGKDAGGQSSNVKTSGAKGPGGKDAGARNSGTKKPGAKSGNRNSASGQRPTGRGSRRTGA